MEMQGQIELHAIMKAKDDKEVKNIGIEWCIAQCKELKAAKVPVLHFYTMGKSADTARIAKEIW